MEHYQRLIKKNEATGIRVVLQYVREFWESGWQENEARNHKGIDYRSITSIGLANSVISYNKLNALIIY